MFLRWTFLGRNCANCIVNSNMGMGSTVPPKTHSIVDSLCTDVCCMVGWRCVHEYVCVGRYAHVYSVSWGSIPCIIH